MADFREMSFRWIIKKIDMCTAPPGEKITSPSFSIDTYKSTDFLLALYPRGRKDGDSRYISIDLYRKNDQGPEKLSLMFEMSLVETQGSVTNVNRSKEIQYTKGHGWGYIKFYARDLLFQFKADVFQQNNLTVECKLLPMNNKECNVVDHERYICDEEVEEKLSTDVAKILENEIHSDMTLNIGGEHFHVHKAVLQCRSPKLFQQLEYLGFPNTYTLSNIDANDIRNLLHYLYSGILHSSCVNRGIFTAAKTFELPDLCNAFPFPKRILAVTDNDVTHASFEWDIKNINDFQEGKELVYNPFYDENLKKTIQIVLTVKNSKNGSNDIFLNFRRMNASTVLFVRCKITILDSNKMLNNNLKEFEHLFETENDWETSLCSAKRLKESVRDDTLNLFFEVSISNGECSSKIEEISYEAKAEEIGEESFKNLKSLQKDLKSLHNNPKFPDVTLSVGDTKYPAHKAILCGRSRVFARMFERDMVGTQKCIINIDDIDLPTVSSMLLYIYCGYIKAMNVSEAIHLYAAADKYELLLLKEQCSTFLKSNLNTNDIGEILLLADAYHDESLRECVYNFITCNAEEVLSSEEFLSTLNSRVDVYPNVLKSLLQHIARLKRNVNS